MRRGERPPAHEHEKLLLWLFEFDLLWAALKHRLHRVLDFWGHPR